MSDLQAALGYTFRRAELLERALTHSSHAYEKGLGMAACNERLEFLGDAVLELCVSEYLYKKFPNMPEGKLTKNRAALVCELSLVTRARILSLGEHVKFGYGEKQSGGAEKGSILADVLEAVLGAVYLDGGLEAAKDLVGRLFADLPAQAAPLRDNKTTLQELLQKHTRETAVYEIIEESGPPHKRAFVAQVKHQGKVLAQGEGNSKKEAEQAAAGAALERNCLL